MDINNSSHLTASDDQELAQVLAGMNQQAAEQPAADAPVENNMQFEETGTVPEPAADPAAPTDEPAPAVEPTPTQPPLDNLMPELPVADTPVPAESNLEPTDEPARDAPSPASPELESIKKDALEQLRPLVDKLNLPAQEKFDTLLLIIRSTDDQSLLPAANDAAKAIEDQTKRAEALLDVIKEIDFFSHPAQ